MDYFSKFPNVIKIVEVAPRDGLQNEKTLISTDDKFTFIVALVEAALKTIEVTSFVKPPAIPQMHDSRELFSRVKNHFKNRLDLSFPCLVPNQTGWEYAQEVCVSEIALFTSTSNSFNQKNINTDVNGQLKRITPIAQDAIKNGVKVRGYLSTVFGCPYQGEIVFSDIENGIKAFDDLGVYEISLGDTIGCANPKQVYNILNLLEQKRGLKKLALHFHDTRSLAIANIFMGLQCGINVYDSSAGGIGGCPYAKGASGNVSTESVHSLFSSLGFDTGINSHLLAAASQRLLDLLGKNKSK